MDLHFLLLSRINRGFMLVKSFLQEGIRVISSEVELSTLLDDRRWLECSSNQVMMESMSHGSIEDPLVIG